MIRSLESKLPDKMKEEWLRFMNEPINQVTPENHVDSLLKYLKREGGILEKLEQLCVEEMRR